MTVWVMVIIVLNGGHAYEMSRTYATQDACIEAASYVSRSISTTVSCIPATEVQE